MPIRQVHTAQSLRLGPPELQIAVTKVSGVIAPGRASPIPLPDKVFLEMEANAPLMYQNFFAGVITLKDPPEEETLVCCMCCKGAAWSHLDGDTHRQKLRELVHHVQSDSVDQLKLVRQHNDAVVCSRGVDYFAPSMLHLARLARTQEFGMVPGLDASSPEEEEEDWESPEAAVRGVTPPLSEPSSRGAGSEPGVPPVGRYSDGDLAAVHARLQRQIDELAKAAAEARSLNIRLTAENANIRARLNLVERRTAMGEDPGSPMAPAAESPTDQPVGPNAPSPPPVPGPVPAPQELVHFGYGMSSSWVELEVTVATVVRYLTWTIAPLVYHLRDAVETVRANVEEWNDWDRRRRERYRAQQGSPSAQP